MAAVQIDPNAPDWVRTCINLADPRLGAQGLRASDEFFAPLERMLNPEPAVFVPGKYDEHGKWMDGWETRRKRVNGYDWSILKLGVPGAIQGVDIDTSHFTGNYPPAASIEGCWSDVEPGDDAAWTEVLPATSLKGNSHHYLPVSAEGRFTHLRLNIYPDGGVARLRVYGTPATDWSKRDKSALYDLVAAENGGRIVGWNDAHFGLPHNLLMPGRGVNMGDGWETRRRREPGNDWCVIQLGHPGVIDKIEVDTCHFKGNFPDRCSIQAARVTGGTDQSMITQSMFWPVLLPEQKLSMDAQHHFESEIQKLGAVTHIRFNIHPDGGVSRLRLFGRVA